MTNTERGRCSLNQLSVGTPPGRLRPRSLWYVVRLGVPRIHMRLPVPLSVLPARPKDSGELEFFILLECLNHMWTQKPLAKCCFLPTAPASTTDTGAPCLSQFLCACTWASAAATQAQNGTCPLSAWCWALIWIEWGDRNLLLLFLGLQVPTSP